MSRHHFHSHGHGGPKTLHGGLFQLGFIFLFLGAVLSVNGIWMAGVLLIPLGVLALVGAIYIWNRKSGLPPQQGPPPQYGSPQYGQQPGYPAQGPPQYIPPQVDENGDPPQY